MGIYDLVKDDLVLILTVLLYAILIWKGYQRGLVRMLTSLVSVAAAIFLGMNLAPKIVPYMDESHAWVLWVETEVLPKLKGISRETVFTAICFVAVFLVSLALLKILAATLDRIAKLPILNFLNKALGVVFGICEATVYIWILMIVINILPHVPVCANAIREISENELLSVLYQNNFINAFLQSIH